jgi:hypothetical protein
MLMGELERFRKAAPPEIEGFILIDGDDARRLIEVIDHLRRLAEHLTDDAALSALAAIGIPPEGIGPDS